MTDRDNLQRFRADSRASLSALRPARHAAWALLAAFMSLFAPASAWSAPQASARTDKPQDAAATVEVTVTGFGGTPQEALDDAIRTALRQVAGEFVRSDSAVEGDELVQDKVIAHSQGFVERATKIGEPVLKDGVYRQRVAVKVRKSRVAEVLREPAKSQGQADGVSMYARIKSMRERQASAAELMEVLFDGFPANVMKCEISEGPTELEPGADPSFRVPPLGPGQAFVLVKVDLAIDQAKWKEWCRGAREVFTAVAEVSQRVRWNPRLGGAQRVSIERGIAPDFIRYFAGGMSDAAAESEHLCLNARTSEALAQTMFAMRAPAQPTAPGSIKAPRSGGGKCLHVGLLSSLDGELEVFAIPSTALKRWSMATPHGVPAMSVTLLDEAGRALASPAAGATGGEPRAALVMDSRNYLVGSPAFVGMFGVNSQVGGPRGVVLMPALESGCYDYSNPNDDFDGCGVAVSRLSMPFGFIVPVSDLPRIKSVQATLGKALLRNPGFADEFAAGIR